MWILLFSDVTLLWYKVSTILLPIEKRHEFLPSSHGEFVVPVVSKGFKTERLDRT